MLLVGAVNVTNLMLVRSSARMKELATRHALGAALGRIAGQLLTETMLLPLAAACSACARLRGVRALSAFGLEATPQGTTVSIDAPGVTFALALVSALAVLIGARSGDRPAPSEPQSGLPRRGTLGHREPRRARCGACS